MAVAVGFEPTVGYKPTQHFECCTFGRSDTPPRKRLLDVDCELPIASKSLEQTVEVRRPRPFDPPPWQESPASSRSSDVRGLPRGHRNQGPG